MKFIKIQIKSSNFNVFNRQIENYKPKSIVKRIPPITTTTVKMLTSPGDHFLQLNNIDYELPRSKDEILEIFTI